MKPARLFVQMHAAVFVVAVLFSVALFAFQVVGRDHMLLSTIVFMAFGEVVLAIERALISSTAGKNVHPEI